MRYLLRRIAASLAVAAVGCASAPAPGAPPVALRVTTELGEVEAPRYVWLRIQTTEVNGAPAAVADDTPVTLADAYGKTTTLTIPAGASSAGFVWAARVGGLYRLRATADGLAAGSILLPIRASSDPDTSVTPVFPTDTVTQPTTPTWSPWIFIPGIMRGRPGAGGGKVDVVYRSDTPVAGTEQAQAVVTLRTASNGLATADRDIIVQLSSGFATISTREVTIPAQRSSTIANGQS